MIEYSLKFDKELAHLNLRAKVIENMVSYGTYTPENISELNRVPLDVYDFIAASFSWNNSIEGADYWTNIYKRNQIAEVDPRDKMALKFLKK